MALPRACSRHSKSGAALMEAGKNALVDPIIEYPFAISRACIQQTKSVAPGQMAKTQAIRRCRGIVIAPPAEIVHFRPTRRIGNGSPING
jgi:hypothetical protein